MAANWTRDQVIAQLTTVEPMWHWTGSTITYAFPTSASGMNASSTEKPGFRAANGTQQAFLTLALQTWDDLIPQTMQQTSLTTSDVEFAYSTSMGDSYAHVVTYSPPSAISAGNTWFSLTVGTDADNSTTSPTIGLHGFETLIHEIGHSLGLNHMGSYNANNGQPVRPSSYQDSTVYTVMSYFGPSGPYRSSEVAGADWVSPSGQGYDPQTPMLNDILAIQSIYGISTTTRTGDTVYGFSCNITGAAAQIYDFSINRNPILALFDSGGNDTLNLSNWTAPSLIYLESGVYSSGNNMTNNIVIAYNCVIENAVGGTGNDQLTGNASANRLEGGAGNDQLTGGAGNDTLIGGAGADVMDGGADVDTCVFSSSYASYTITFSATTSSYRLIDSTGIADTVSNVEFFQFSDQIRAASQLLSADTTAPLLTATTPSGNATGVAIASNLVLAFNEAVQAGSGSIIIHYGNGTVAKTILVTDASQVTISGSTVTINPATDLAPGSDYYVTVAADVIKDRAGNGFAGISRTTIFNFSTAASDSTPPLLLSTSPSDDATGVALAANLVFTFNETAQAGSGNIVIYNNNGTVAKTISVGDAAQVVFSGSTVTVNPSSDLIAGNSYYVNLAPGVITDRAGNSFAGVSGSSAFNFATVASASADDYPWNTNTSGVVLVGGAASTGVVNFVDDLDLFKVVLAAGTTYVFDLESVTGGLNDPYLKLFNPSLDLLAQDDDSGSGMNARISFTATISGTYYLGAYDAGSGTGAYTLKAAVSGDDFPWDTATNGLVTANASASSGVINYVDDLDLFKVVLTAGTTYIFDLASAVGGLDDPYLKLFDPAADLLDEDDDSGAGLNARIVYTATSSGTYYLGAYDRGSGTGAYTLKATAVVDDYPWDTLTNGVVVVNGAVASGVINFIDDNDLFKLVLSAGTSYTFVLTQTPGGLADPYLRLYGSDVTLLAYDDDSGGSRNSLISYTATASGTYYLGACDYGSGTGGYTLRATTADTTAPLLSNTSPSDNATGVESSANLVFTFNEAVQAGIGNIIIYNGNGSATRTIAVTDTAQVSFSGNTLTVNPGADLLPGASYYVNMASGVVTDAAGNHFGGILSASAFNFTTLASTAIDDYPLSTATSGRVTVGATAASGVIETVDDGDLFKIDLLANASYFFDLVRVSGGLDDPYLQLYSPALDLITTDDDSGGAQNARIAFTSSTGGTYYLAAWDYAYGMGAYTLSATIAAQIFTGTSGNDSFAGSPGADQMAGGLGNDTYYVNTQADLVFENVNEGVDSVIASASFYLYDNIENLTLAAGNGNLFGSGNALDNTITGNEGDNLLLGWDGNDTLVGITGADILYGVEGNDALFGGAGVDVLVGGNGADTLDGGADSDALYGEAGNDVLYGGTGFATDILVGGAGNDILDGSASLASAEPRNQGDYDLMDGGAGDDSYYVDTPADLTFEAVGGGTDTVIADINGAGYYLYANVENLTLVGNTPFGVGNELNNILIGNAQANWLLGGAGNDTLNGKAGNDVLFGEAGADIFVFEHGNGGDVLGDFTQGVDQINLVAIAYTSFAQVQLHMVQNGASTAIDLGQGDFIVLVGVQKSTLTAGDFVLA